MNTQRYTGRLPALRLSAKVVAALEDRAAQQGITLAEAHRQVIALGLREKVRLAILGTTDGDTIRYFEQEAA